MRTMKVTEFGGPEVLQSADATDPIPPADGVVVEHDFVGVNFVDAQHRAGAPYPVALPLVVGIEAVGRIVEIGPKVHDVAVGDRVGYGGIMPGVYAERAAVPADQLVAIPDDIGSDVAAATLVQGWTAHMLFDVGGRDVLDGDAVVFGAGGGTGSLLVQLLVDSGIRTIGITSGDARCASVDALGARAVDRTKHDIVRAVLDLTGGGAGVVFDGVGGPAFDQARRMLRPTGHLVAFGQSAGAATAIDPAVLSGLSAAGGPGSLRLTWPTLNDHNPTAHARRRRTAEVFSLVRSGVITPRFDASLGLSRAAEAHRRLESGEVMGKLILDARR